MLPIRFRNFKKFNAITFIITAAIVISGCFGSFYRMRSHDIMSAETIDFEGNPDNCTKCHLLWAKHFDYFRGWDRYGYIFGSNRVAGYYDPWTTGAVDNMFQAYYSTRWWDTPELYPWPDDSDQKVESLSVLSSDNGLPEIPGSLEEIDGPVLVVAQQNGDFTGIQKAIDKADRGTTIYVRPGIYNEVLTLKNGINLIGENPETTIINPLNKGHALIAANNSIIAGFTFTGTGIDYEKQKFNAAIYAAGTDSTCIIACNIFRENGLFGIWIDGAVNSEENRRFNSEYGSCKIEIHDRPYTDYPNPVIVGNTFYRIGQRGIFCVHARGEIFNNIFLGNVKAVGLERHSRPIFHHNVFFFNNVPMAVNRSEPVICNNIMYKNQWGQRMLRGANPVMFNNVTWESPHFRDFDEEGRPYYYETHPGTGERTIDPGFIDPLAGDFRFSAASPFHDTTFGFKTFGIMRDPNLPQPAQVICRNSYGREVLAMTDDIVKLIEKVDIENARIRDLSASYRITYESWLDFTPDTHGGIKTYSVKPPDKPAVRIEYEVPVWVMEDSKRFKKYREHGTMNGEKFEDSGTITFDGSCITAAGGRFDEYYNSSPDPLFIGERPFREAPGGFYRDYDQFVKGAIGSTGTFYHGYLRIMGGKIEEGTATIDGHECIIVRYPHIGKDQYFLFYLDPSIGYRPLKMEQYYNEALYRRMDSYRYKAFSGNIYLPVYVKVTDYAVMPDDLGKIVATWSLQVDEKSVALNK